MTLKDSTRLRAELTAILMGVTIPEIPQEIVDIDIPLDQAIMENYVKFKSIKKVSKVLSRYYGHHIPEYSVSRILKDNGVEIKARSPSIYDSQL